MNYPVRLKPDGEFYMVTFPDIPGAITQGEGVDDALRQALDALETVLDFYIEEGKLIPLPSQQKRGQRLLKLPLEVNARILLHNEMVRQKVGEAELARRMGISQRKFMRILSWKYDNTIDMAALAFQALGNHLEVYLA